MKNLIALFIIVFAAMPSHAAKGYAKDYDFKFKYKGNEYKTTHTAPSYDEAFVVAAQECFNHFTETSGNEKVSESKGLEVIDTCANPRM